MNLLKQTANYFTKYPMILSVIIVGFMVVLFTLFFNLEISEDKYEKVFKIKEEISLLKKITKYDEGYISLDIQEPLFDSSPYIQKADYLSNKIFTKVQLLDLDKQITYFFEEKGYITNGDFQKLSNIIDIMNSDNLEYEKITFKKKLISSLK